MLQWTEHSLYPNAFMWPDVKHWHCLKEALSFIKKKKKKEFSSATLKK